MTEAGREPFVPNNDIRIVVIEDGWLWAIPLTHARLSIGMVSRKPGLRHSTLDAYLRESPLFTRMIAGAKRHLLRTFGGMVPKNEVESLEGHGHLQSR